MIRVRFLLVLAALASSVFSCNIINPDEDIPAYIQIDSFNLVDNPNVVEGSLKHDIVDAHVYVNDNLIGIYELPARIPVLEKGSQKLTVGPGIKVSTQSRIRDNYQFFGAHIDENYSFTPGEVTFLTPQVMYRDTGASYSYRIIDDFESSFYSLDSFSYSDAPLLQSNDPNLVFEGNGSGVMQLTADMTQAAVRSKNMRLPSQAGKTVYLEMHYYSDYYCQIGVHANNVGLQNQYIDYLILKPTTDDDDESKWKKVYVELTDVTASAANPQNFFIYFQLVLDDEDSRKDGYFLMDNVKILFEK